MNHARTDLVVLTSAEASQLRVCVEASSTRAVGDDAHVGYPAVDKALALRPIRRGTAALLRAYLASADAPGASQ